MTRDQLDAYVACFNKLDTEGLCAYFADGVKLHLPPRTLGGPGRVLDGPAAIVEFYTSQSHLREEYIEPRFVAIDGDRIAAEFYTEFRAKTDVPHFFAMPLKSGDVFVFTGFVFYELENDKFKNIRVAGYSSDTSRVASAGAH